MERLKRLQRTGAAILTTLLLATGTASAAPLPTLSTGNRGADVAIMQRLLTYRNNPVAITELIGPTTRGLIQNFQRQRGLTPDGVVGPVTWHTLEPVLRPGANNVAVTALQVALDEKLGDSLPATGYFGSATENAVIEFQRGHGLTPDGVVGPATWDKLISHYIEMPESGTGFYRCFDATSTWGTANTVATLQMVARQWQSEGYSARLGVNDMSLPEGQYFWPHSAHQDGRDADLRLMRSDGQELAVQSWWDPSYSRSVTQHLVDMLWATGQVEFILFNDPNIKGVKPWDGHDDHLHVHFKQ